MPLQFEEQDSFQQKFAQSQGQKMPGMYKWLIKNGFARNERQAEYYLIFISIICLLLAIYIYTTLVFGYSFAPKKKVVPPPEIQKMLNQIKAQQQK